MTILLRINKRHVGAGVARQFAGEAGVVVDLDHEAIGFETLAAVEAQRIGMVKVAGVDPEAVDRLLPGLGNGDIHQCTA